MPASLSEDSVADRQAVLATLAMATGDELAAAFKALPAVPDFEIIRAPEIGLVMARGRIGGGGAAFNLGEITVTRAVVRSAGGHVGFGHVLGRDRERALFVARFDALWQDSASREQVESVLLTPLRRRISSEKSRKARETAATRVNFFTLVRGEDE